MVMPEDFLAALQQDPATKAFYVNRHRRIGFGKLRRYQAEQQQNSEQALQDLAKLSEELGLEFQLAGSSRYTGNADANVLYPQLLRDTLLSLAVAGLYHARCPYSGPAGHCFA